MKLQPDVLEELRLLGGVCSLDYVNSVEDRASQTPEEFLRSAVDVVRWGAHAGLLAPEAAAALRAWAAADDDAGSPQALAFQQAVAVRETLHDLFLAVATAEPLPGAELVALQTAWAQVMRTARLTPEGDDMSAGLHLAWTWALTDGGSGLDPVVGPVLVSALELLTDQRSTLGRVKVCANPHGCGWLFYDSSRNASRRWCSMEGCGSRVKMQRQYARSKAARAGDAR